LQLRTIIEKSGRLIDQSMSYKLNREILLKLFVLAVMSFSFASACWGVNLTTNLITFDDLGEATGQEGIEIPNYYGYSGFTWTNFYVIDGINYYGNPSGYEPGTISSNNVAYNGNGDPATIASSQPFSLVSADLTAAWNDALELEVQGYLSGALIYDNTYTLSSTSPTVVTFNYSGVDEVNFISSGGIQNSNYVYSGEQFAMDNLLVVTASGALTVAITPPGAVDAGAKWTVDQITWQDSGVTVSNLAAGQYAVQFSDVAGWSPPANQVVTISEGQLTRATGNYLLQGLLQVTITPPGAVDAGAQWTIDGLTWQDSGDTVSNLTAGQYTVEFSDIGGWATPSNQVVVVTGGETKTVTGDYFPSGSLEVTVLPANAVAAGAQWTVDGETWQDSGETVSNLVVGQYTVEFRNIAGWATPSGLLVTISQNANTSVTALYLALTNQLQIQLVGLGKVLPNYSNAWLRIGDAYSITSSPAAGFKFAGWTLSTNWAGGVSTTNPALHFVMASNLTLLATFADTNPPVLAVTAPVANQRMTNAVAAVGGMASDNWGVSGVWYQLNGGAWVLAGTTNCWSNWNVTLPLLSGTNTILAYARDWGGNYSPTSSVSVLSSNTFKLQLAVADADPLLTGGLAILLQLSSNLNGHIEYSTNLVNWLSWTNFQGTNSSITFRDPAATNAVERFYRAVIP
jgi:hypothetical protein